MGKTTGFKEYLRELPEKRPVAERIRDYREIYLPFPEENLVKQAARCMDCGVPTCHSGCPLANLIPDWNDQVYQGRRRAALDLLHRTNNFPEFTGRLCPAPCEEACVLAVNEPAVTIELIEKEIIEHAFSRGWVVPEPPERRTGKQAAVVGSGPAGLACAQQLNRAGHRVTVFERDDRIGGLLRYGIPDYKMDKAVIDRRLAILAAEGIQFRTGVHVGVDLGPEELDTFDAVVLCSGAGVGRDMPVPGRDLAGVHLAMEYLPLQNRRVAGDDVSSDAVTARGKRVIVLGGGDTSADCIGNCIREGAALVRNFIKYPEPPEGRPDGQPWPYWPDRLRTTPAHEEGCDRRWSLMATAFLGQDGRVTGVRTVDTAVSGIRRNGKPRMTPVPGTERVWPADLVLLAIGFTGPETGTIIGQYGLALDAGGGVRVDDHFMTSRRGVFAAGDAHLGASLIVRAIADGREAARGADRFLMGRSFLPTRGPGDLPGPAPAAESPC